ncbi:MAG: PA2169 family four-helix-bundle protein [Acidobacteriota bacterium]
MINDYEATHPMTTDAIPAYDDTTPNDEVISTLNGLIQTCKDGQEGFKDAAENVKSPSLKALFFENSLERSRFVGELQELVRSLGGDPEKTGTLLAAVHRGWLDLKTAISSNDEAAVLNECERGEDSAKATYAAAIAKALPDQVLDLVKTQSKSINEAHDRIKALRDAANDAVLKAAAAK